MINYEVLSIPAPFLAGPVNVYLIKNDPVTLIDCGPNYPESKAALVEKLSSFGLKLEDIKQIIITHAHTDHYGLAAEIQRISKAAVYMHKKEVSKTRCLLKYQENVIDYLAYAGVPEGLCRKHMDHYTKQNAEAPEEITGVEDGHIFSFDEFELEGILTSGHSSGHLSFFHLKEGLLFAGDTILENVRQKPQLELFLEQPLKREKNMIQYVSSLEYIKQLEISRILPGHGEPIFDIKSVLEELETNFRIRKEEINGIAARLKVFTPFSLISEMYSGFRNPLGVAMAIAESLGYLDVLEAEKRVEQLHNRVPLTYSCL